MATTKVSQNLLDSLSNFSIGAPFTVTGSGVTTLGGNLVLGGTVASGDEGGEIGFARPPNLGGSLGCALDLHATGFRFIADYGSGTQTVTVKLPASGSADFIHSAGGQTIGGNCQIDTSGNIKLDRASSERNISFTNAGTNQIYFYGNAVGSTYDVGLYDGKNTRGVWRYDESLNRFDVEAGDATWGSAYLRRSAAVAGVATTSGTNVDILTGLPSWVDEIVISLEGFSMNSASSAGIQLGHSTAWQATGYVGIAQQIASTTAAISNSTRFQFLTSGSAPAGSYDGHIFLTRRSGTNLWNCSGVITRRSANESYNLAGAVNLGANVLTRVRLNTGGTMDAGVASAHYSGLA